MKSLMPLPWRGCFFTGTTASGLPRRVNSKSLCDVEKAKVPHKTVCSDSIHPAYFVVREVAQRTALLLIKKGRDL
jgi:hypothetical protein